MTAEVSARRLVSDPARGRQAPPVMASKVSAAVSRNASCFTSGPCGFFSSGPSGPGGGVAAFDPADAPRRAGAAEKQADARLRAAKHPPREGAAKPRDSGQAFELDRAHLAAVLIGLGAPLGLLVGVQRPVQRADAPLEGVDDGPQQIALIAPAGDRTSLVPPSNEVAEPMAETATITLFPADLGARKLAFTEDSGPGVYQIEAVSQANYYTQYIDTEGRSRLALKPRDEVEGIDRVLMSIKYQAFAKTAVTLGDWTEPAPLGHDLEIIPRTDMSDLHVGDLVEVDVLFHGQPLTATARSIEYITAQGTGFGQGDGFALFSYLKEGRAQFRVQSRGQWIISVGHKEDVTSNGPLADLVGKADQVYHGASLTFSVRESEPRPIRNMVVPDWPRRSARGGRFSPMADRWLTGRPSGREAGRPTVG